MYQERSILHPMFIFVIVSFFTLTSQGLAMTCNDISSNYCLIDQSSTYQVFCSGSSGHTYKGGINCKDRWQGFGTYDRGNGSYYKGYYQNGKKHGKGEAKYESGNKYKGDFHLGKRHGFGTYYFKDGNKYEGNFLNNNRHGKGTFYFKGGDYSKVQYSNGKRVGKEIYYYKDGRITEITINLDGSRGKSKQLKSAYDVEQEKKIARENKERREKERKEYLAKLEKEEKLRKRKEKKRKLKMDKCILKIYTPGKNWKENDARELCKIAFKADDNVIKRNCIIQKGKYKNKSLLNSVENVCEEVSKNPSTFEKILYGETLSNTLEFFK